MNLYYIQTNMICFVVLGVIGALMHGRRENTPARRRAFLCLIVIIAFICLSDIFAWIYNGKSGAGSYFVLMFFNIIYYCAITAAGYVWLCYVRIRVGGVENYSRRFRLLSSIPLVITIIIAVTTPFTSFLFSVGADNVYLRGSGVVLHWMFSWGYLFYAGFLVLKKIRKTDSAIEKRQLRPLLWFIVPPAVASGLQMLFYGVTTAQCGMTLSALIIAFTAMQEKVSTDSLTDLNNRNAFENFINERINRLDDRFVLLMCDVDRFKTINDSLGHIVGDIVLKRMATILKNVCAESRCRLFLCRYGGDEFIICSTDAGPDEISRIKESIAAKLVELNNEYPSEIRLGMSIGAAEGLCRNSSEVDELIRKADLQMYEEKNLNRPV